MTHEALVHEAQTKILRELLFVPQTNFAELQKVSELESDHAKFHIKRLVELGYIDKTGSSYKLSVKGKEYANKLDTDAGVIERQPKSAVMLMVERETSNGKEYLLQQRLKHPLYGYWGVPTGKIRWGESVLETAARELMEETGLTGTFSHCGIYHERVRHKTTGEIVEDKIFHLMFCSDSTGPLKDVFEGGHNEWRTLASMTGEAKKYKSFEAEIDACLSSTEFSEALHEYSSEEF